MVVAVVVCSAGAWAQMTPSEQEREKRIQRMKEIVTHNPRDVGMWHDLATLYREAERWDEAIEAESKAIEGHPKYAVAYYGRGKAKMAKKEYAAAREDFSKAIELFQSRVKLEDFYTLEQASEEHVDSYRTRGMTWANQGDYARGIADLDIAVRLQKNDARLHYERAYLREKAGRNAEAAADYKLAGLIYFDYGDRRKAEECLAALERLKAGKEAAELKKRLDAKKDSDLPP
jgi:tetratricopeptide (TPR) repeat protein